jgi:aspartate racemase
VHKHADIIEAMTGLPVVNIIDATAHRIQTTGMDNILLLGTDYTMSGSFYKDRMAESGITCMVPETADRAEVHRIIFEELVHGVVDDGSHRTLVDIIDAWAEQGAEGVVLGCTELGLILNEDDARIPGFDTTRIHCHAIVDAALD